MLDEASDAKDAVSLNRRPHLPPTDSDAAGNLPPMNSDAAGKDKDVVADVAAALLLDSIQEDVDPPSCQSWQEEHQGTWHLQPSVEDIMHHHPRHNMSRPPRTRTSRRSLRDGTRVIHVVLTSQMDIPARHAITI
jgi:hypothetical protein